MLIIDENQSNVKYKNAYSVKNEQNYNKVSRISAACLHSSAQGRLR